MAFEKRYIGNGVQVPNYPHMVEVAVEYDALVPFEYNGKKYVKFTVGQKREVDKYGKTHAVWVSEKVDDGNPQNDMNAVDNPSHVVDTRPDYYPTDEAGDIPF